MLGASQRNCLQRLQGDQHIFHLTCSCVNCDCMSATVAVQIKSPSECWAFGVIVVRSRL